MAYNKTMVGRRIKSLRVDKGYSQLQLAELSGIPQGTLSQYEQGLMVMGLENAAKIADALECSIDLLACRA